MLGNLSLILVYLGNVGGNILWLTISENPIVFGESSVIIRFLVNKIKFHEKIRHKPSGCVPSEIVFFIAGITSTAPDKSF